MGDDDIYNLAQQAGLYGDQPLPSATPSYADATGQYGFTDEDMLAHFVPQDDSAQDSTPAASLFQQGPQLTPPSFTPSSSAPPTLPGSEKAGVSVSQSGFSPSKNKQVRQGPGARLDQKIAGINEQGQQMLDDRTAGFKSANAEEVDAAHAEAKATADQITAAGHEKLILSQLGQAYDQKTNELFIQGMGEANQSKADYVAALNDFRAARVNPAQLWDNIGTGGQVGMLVAAFVQDFLGVKGIHTSAMDTWNKAIDRNIDAQVNAINNKGKVADGFKTLWDMQMAQSHSVQEARARMRPFMLDSLKTAAEAHMAQFDAALATAKGRAAIAKIDTELQKNILEVSKHIDTFTSTRINQEIARYGDELRASMDAAKIAVDRERNQIERDKMKPQTINPYENVIYDNTDSGKGMGRWEFNDPKNTTLNNEVLKKQASTDQILRLSRQYQDLQRRHAHNQGLASGTRWGSAEDHKLKALANEILSARILEKSGKAATDAERKALSIGTPQALFSGTLDIAPLIAQTENIERQSFESMLATAAHKLDPNDPRTKYQSSFGSHYGETENKEASAIASGDDKRESPAQRAANQSIKGLEKHTAFETAEEVPADVKADHEAFMANNPELFSNADLGEQTAVRNYEVNLSHLKRQAEKAKDTNGSVYEDVVGKLKNAAAPIINGTSTDDAVAKYAFQMLQDLGEDVSRVTDEDPGVDQAVSHLPPIPGR